MPSCAAPKMGALAVLAVQVEGQDGEGLLYLDGNVLDGEEDLPRKVYVY